MIFSLLPFCLIDRRNRFGCPSFTAANVCRVSIGWLTMSLAIMAGNMVFLILNVHAYRNWLNADSGRLQNHEPKINAPQLLK
jgi:hypothetical protein